MPEAATRRQANLLISFILIVGICLVIATWGLIASVMETERRVAIAHATVEANNLSAAFGNEVEDTLDAVSMAAASIARRMQTQPRFDLYHWARQIPLLSQPAISGATIIHPDGTVASTTLEPSPAGVNLRDRGYFRQSLASPNSGIVVGHPMVGRLTGATIIPVARRVVGADGKLLGVIAFSLAPGRLTRLNRSVDLGSGGFLTLLGDDNIVRAQFGPGTINGETPTGSIISLPHPAVGSARPLSLMHAGSPGQPQQLLSLRAIPKYNLLVCAGLDMDEVLRPVRARTRELIGVSAAFTLVLAGLLGLLTVEIRRRARHEVELTVEKAGLTAEIERRERVEVRLRKSEERMRDFAEMASDWFWEQGADLCFSAIGPNSPVSSGRLAGDYVGKTRWAMHDTGRAPEKWAAHRKTVEAHQPFRDFVYDVQATNGRFVRLSASGKPLFDDSGTFLGYRGTGRDLTREMEAEAAVLAAKDRAEEAEMLLRDAVESMSEGFVIFDRDDRLVLCNEAFRVFDGRTSEVFVPGTSFTELLQAGVDAGSYPDAIGREDAWLAGRVEHHQCGTGALEVSLSNGRWVLATDRRMHNGGVAGLRVDITALKQVQDALRVSEARLERAQEVAGICTWELNIPTGAYFWSQQMYRLFGLSAESFKPTTDTVMLYTHTEDRRLMQQWLADIGAGRSRSAVEYRVARPDGAIRLMRSEAVGITGADGAIRKIVGAAQDITERRLFEQRLLQAQKMDAVGNLSGGLAHDFNNLLGVIIGNLHLLSEMLQDQPEPAELCDDALDAARRGADLVRRLLAFGRRQALRPQPTDINQLIADVSRLLSKIIGEDVDLGLQLASGLHATIVDPVQLEAALTNLIANARDAMARGGRLTIATRILRLDPAYAVEHGDIAPGDYVLIEVADTGAGMAPEVLARVFEPFFTTKEQGRGTGLGLSMVFGFMKQSGGHVSVYSEIGRGSTVRLYIPYRRESLPDTLQLPSRQPVYGSETVLLVEDNPGMRRTTERQLSDLGYAVTAVSSPADALQVLQEMQVALLLTDVVMPGEVDGFELARQAASRQPGIRVLLMSGFSTARFQRSGQKEPKHRLISKPFDREELGAVVREVLDDDMTEREGARETAQQCTC